MCIDTRKSKKCVIQHSLSSEESISEGICSNCGDNSVKFRDALSVKEYKVTGLCQKCQDIVFD